MDIAKFLDNLVDLRGEAKPETFHSIFGEQLGDHLFGEYVKMDHDLLKLYGRLDGINRQTFADWLAAGAHCYRCGQPLPPEDIEAGETVCLNCTGATFAAGIDFDGPLAASVQVALQNE